MVASCFLIGPAKPSALKIGALGHRSRGPGLTDDDDPSAAAAALMAVPVTVYIAAAMNRLGISRRVEAGAECTGSCNCHCACAGDAHCDECETASRRQNPGR